MKKNSKSLLSISSTAILFTIFSLLFTNLIFAQKKISKKQMSADLVQLKSKLEKLYVGLYYYETKEDFENRYQKTLNNLPDSLDLLQAYIVLNKFVGGVQDLHTSVFFPKNNIAKDKNKAIPVVVRRNGDKVYLHLNGSSDSTIVRGEEVIAIDHLPVSEILEKSKNLWGTDKANLNSKKFYSERYFARNFNILFGIKDSVTLQLRNVKKDSTYFRKIATELTKNSNKTLAKRYKNINRKNLDLKILDSLNHIAFMDVVSFSQKGNKLDITQSKFNRLLRKNFKAIHENNIQHLIIDFRFNGGGLIANTKRITKYVAPEPFKLLDSTKMTKYGFIKSFPPYLITPYLIGRLIFKKQADGSYLRLSNKTIKPTKKYHYDHKIYVLTDGGSYSATTLTVGLWKDMNIATFVGNTPGGANWGSFAGQWENLKLKNSKIKVHIPLMKLEHAHPNNLNHTFFVEPDYYVDQSFDDFIKRKDSQLNFIINLIKNK